VRFVSTSRLRAYARKVGKSERTICEYERQLVAAGLAHRTVKHARRHGGYGNEARRTGLDWRSFGVLMPELLQRLDQRAVNEERRLDLEARIRLIRRVVLGMLDDIVARAGEGADGFLSDYASLDVARLRGTLTISELERRLGDLSLLKAQIEIVFLDDETQSRNNVAVDNSVIYSQHVDQSEDSSRLIDITDKIPCPSDIRSQKMRHAIENDKNLEHLEKFDGLEIKREDIETGARRQTPYKVARRHQESNEGPDAVPLKEIWKAAPVSWKSALGTDVEISWPALIEVAQHFVPQLEVSPYAWNRALRVLGPSEAALALMVLDRNRDHPVRPVMSVGGALVGMTRRAEQDGFNIVPSLYGIIARRSTDPILAHCQ